MENKDYSKVGNYGNRLENVITKICRVTAKSIDLVSKHLKKSDEILKFRMEQELKVVEIRKNILPHCSEKQLENLPEKYLIETNNLSKKELFSQIRSLSSLPKTRISAHQSERSIFSEKRAEKLYYSDSHRSKSFKSFCSASHSSKSAKGKATSSHSTKPSEKKASALSKSSYSATGSSNAPGCLLVSAVKLLNMRS